MNFAYFLLPILAYKPEAPLFIVICILVSLSLALYKALRGKVGAFVTFLLVGILALSFCPEAFSFTTEDLSAMGVAPNVQFLFVLAVGFLLSYVFACLRYVKEARKEENKGYLLKKPLWVGGLVVWALVTDMFFVCLGESVSYDYSGDNMMRDLHKNTASAVSNVEFVATAELLSDETLSTEARTQNEAQEQNKPIIPCFEELMADSTYQVTFPPLIMQYQTAENPVAYVQRSMSQRENVDKKTDDSSAAKISGNDLNGLKKHIEALEQRRYIQQRSLNLRKRMLPLLREIANGADVNTRKTSHDKWTALHYAAAIGDVALTEWLLTHGADTQLRNDEKQRPVDCIGANHSDEIRRLLSKYSKK